MPVRPGSGPAARARTAEEVKSLSNESDAHRQTAPPGPAGPGRPGRARHTGAPPGRVQVWPPASESPRPGRRHSLGLWPGPGRRQLWKLSSQNVL